MSDGSEPNFKFEYTLWMTDRDLAWLISRLTDRAIHEALLKCDPLVRHRILSQVSTFRKDHAIHGGPWNSEVTDETIKAAQKYIGQVADMLYDEGEIGEFHQRYIA